MIKRLRKKLTPIRALWNRRILQGLAALAGISLIAWGLYQVYRPLGPICVGAALLAEVLTSAPGSKS